jgi:hypothetical protein
MMDASRLAYPRTCGALGRAPSKHKNPALAKTVVGLVVFLVISDPN